MDFLDVFGLQVVLEDQTSANAQSIQRSLNNLGVAVQDVERAVYGSFQRMESIMHSGFQINLWGQRIMDFGQMISGSFAKAGQSVLKLGSEFEIQRMKLNQLYNDAKKGEEVFQHAVNQALKTPFSVKEYVSAVAGLKVSGVDPLKTYMNEKTGEMQDMITFAGDLAAAYGKNMNDAFFSLKEAIAGNDFRSLKHRFDGLSKSVIEASTGMTLSTGGAQKDIEQRAEVFAKFIGQKYGGMMVHLGKTMTGLLSRLKENMEIFLSWVADAGFFKVVKRDLEKLITYIEGNQGTLKQFAKVFSDALILLFKPLSKMVDLGMKAVAMFTEFASAHPVIARLIAVITVATGAFLILAGAITMVSGTFITMVASLATLALNMRMSHGSTRISAMLFQGFGKIILGLSLGMLKFVAISAILATAWKYNLGGVRTSITEFGGDIKEAFRVFQELTKLNDLAYFEGMLASMNSTGGRVNAWAKNMASAFYVVKGFFDYLSDGKVSEDTVRRLDALGALGWLESFIKIEIAIRSMVVGISKYLVGAWNTLKPPILWVIDKVEYLMGLFAKLFNRKAPTLFGKEGEGNFTGKVVDGDWQAVGFIIGNFIAMGIVGSVIKRAVSIGKAFANVNKILKNTSAIAMLGEGNINGGKIKSRNVLTKAGRNLAQPSQFKKLSWFNIVMAKTGLVYERVAGRLSAFPSQLSSVLTKFKGVANTLASPFRAIMMTDMVRKMGRLTTIMAKVATGQKLSTRLQKGTGGLSQAGEWAVFKRDMKALPNKMATSLKTFFSRNNPVIQKVTNTRQSIIDKANNSQNGKGQSGSNGGQTPVKGVREAGARLAGNFVSGIFAGIATALSSSKLGQLLATWVTRAVPIAGALLNPWVLLGLFIALIVGVFSGNELSQKIYQGLIDALEWAVALLIANGIGLIALADAIDNWWEETKRKIAEKIAQFGVDIGTAIGEWATKAGERLDELTLMFINFSEEFIKDPKKALKQLKKDFDEWWTQVKEDASVFAEDIGKAMYNLGVGMMEGFENGFRAIANPFHTFVDDIKAKTRSTIDWVNEKMGTDIKAPKWTVATSKSNAGRAPDKPAPSGYARGHRGMSTGGDIRSAGLFQLHEGEAVVNDPTMNSFQEGVKRLRSMGNNLNANNQSSGQNVVVHQNTDIGKIELVLPNVKSGDPQEIAEALRDPSVIAVLKQVINGSRTAEAMKNGKTVQPNFGVARM